MFDYDKVNEDDDFAETSSLDFPGFYVLVGTLT